MRRGDRLFALVQLIRGRRLSTAVWLAGRLEVSVRTVYRDVADLQARGVPIEGEAGVGYRLASGFDLPPLMFSVDEARALALATRLAQQWLDPGMALAATDAMSRILSVLPPSARAAVESQQLMAMPVGLDPDTARRLQVLREAAQARRWVQITYRDGECQTSSRRVRPLGCFYWGAVWTLAAWCEFKGAFRSFRLDRIAETRVEASTFPAESAKSLAELLRQETGRSTIT